MVCTDCGCKIIEMEVEKRMFYRIMRKARSNSKGFTLVELMVVVVIIGILVAIAIPQFANVTQNAERAAVEANLRTIDGAITMYRAAQGVFPGTPAPLYGGGAGATLLDWPTGPAGAQYRLYDMGAGIYRAAVSGNVGGHNMTAIYYRLENLPW